MGIGVSFRGHDGRTRQFDLSGVPSPGDEAAKLLGAQQEAVARALEHKPDIKQFFGGGGGSDNHTVKLTDNDNRPGPLDKKIDRQGSLTATKNGLALKGDEKVGVGKRELYGVINGTRGFSELVNYDPPGQNVRRIGDEGFGGDAAKEDVDNGGSDTKFQVLTRLRFLSIANDHHALYQFERDVKKTAFGRIVEVGEERKTLVLDLSALMALLLKPTAGNFEPYFDASGNVVRIGEGYYPYGRRFIFRDSESVSFSGDVTLCLKIQHGYNNTAPSAEIIKNTDESANSSDSQTVIPLYSIVNGRISVDYRSCMSLPIRE